MLTQCYIDALLVDEELVDQVWESWDKGETGDQLSVLTWSLIVARRTDEK